MGVSLPIDTPSQVRNFTDKNIRGLLNDPAAARSMEMSLTPPKPNETVFRGDIRTVAILMDEERLQQLERRAADALAGSGQQFLTPEFSLLSSLPIVRFCPTLCGMSRSIIR